VREKGAVDALKGVDVDYGIKRSADLGGDDGDNPAPGTDMELGRFRAEDIS
jgi:hypothetical protein